MLTATDASIVGGHGGRADALSFDPERQSAQTVVGETSRRSVRPDTLTLLPARRTPRQPGGVRDSDGSSSGARFWSLSG